MSNLLPQEQKNKITKIYRKRLLIIFLVGTVLTTILATIALIPSLFLSQIKEKAVIRGAALFEKVVNLRKDNGVTLILRDEKEKVDVLGNIDTEGKIKVLLEQVVDDMTNQIKLKGFFFEEKKGEFNNLVLRGLADNRGAILEFTKNLDEEDNFKNIDLPISDLIKGEGINFSITLNVIK